jgi:hypothetical protein
MDSFRDVHVKESITIAGVHWTSSFAFSCGKITHSPPSSTVARVYPPGTLHRLLIAVLDLRRHWLRILLGACYSMW